MLKLYAITIYFHLSVGSTKKFYNACCVNPNDVSGFIEASLALDISRELRGGCRLVTKIAQAD